MAVEVKDLSARAEATRDALLDGMERLLAEGGVAACTSTAVAGEAGYAAGTFYRYFDDRDAALAALFADRLDAIVGAVDGVLTADRLLDDGLRGVLATAVDVTVDGYRRHAQAIRAALASVQSVPAVRAVYWERHARSVEVVTRFLRRGAAAGLVRGDRHRAAAHTLLLVVQGLNNPIVLSSTDRRLVAAVKREMVDLLVALLSPRTAAGG